MMNNATNPTTTFLGGSRVQTHTVPASKVVKELSYDTVLAELTVTINTGERYVYSGVSEEVFEGFKTAPSAGHYFAKVFGQGTYTFHKLSA